MGRRVEGDESREATQRRQQAEQREEVGRTKNPEQNLQRSLGSTKLTWLSHQMSDEHTTHEIGLRNVCYVSMCCYASVSLLLHAKDRCHFCRFFSLCVCPPISAVFSFVFSFCLFGCCLRSLSRVESTACHRCLDRVQSLLLPGAALPRRSVAQPCATPLSLGLGWARLGSARACLGRWSHAAPNRTLATPLHATALHHSSKHGMASRRLS